MSKPRFKAPASLRLEASSICQLRCPTCPGTRGELSAVVGRGYLRFEDFRSLVDHNPSIRRIELSNYGEIFLNPDLTRIVEHAFRKRVRLSADSGVNLNRASEEALESLAKYRFHSMACSIDGATQQSYSTYRVGGDFDRVIANIKLLNSKKDAYGTKHPVLTWQFVIFGHNEHEIGAARRMAHELGMQFRTKLNWDSSYAPVGDPERVRRECGQGPVTREEFLARYGVNYMQETCHQLWEEPQVNWDGEILGCCWNCWMEFGGNAFGPEGLGQALQSEKLIYAKAMLEGRAAARSDIPCTTCDNFLDMQKTGRYLRRGPARMFLRTIRSMRHVPLLRTWSRRILLTVRGCLLKLGTRTK